MNECAESNCQCAAPERVVFRPLADVLETDAAYLIRCDLPGVNESDIELTCEQSVLTLRAAQQETGLLDAKYQSKEYRTGVYERSFRLPRGLDETAIAATLNHGVLEIRLPKSVEAQARRIPVTADPA
jgi:HSP20 family protein